MLTPATISTDSLFYPVGHRPAVSLTQYLPPSMPADVLLLGCGDIRNILFTCHVNTRNILILSLIIDDEDGLYHPDSDDLLWHICNHMFLDEYSLDVIRNQAKKLYDISASLDTWEQSKYGSRISYCDSTTLLGVRNIWNFYNTVEEAGLKRRFILALRIIQRYRATDFLTGFQSTAPAEGDLITQLDIIHWHYQRFGTYSFDPEVRATYKHFNPTFLAVEDMPTIHHRTSPLFGFHLAGAYVPINPSNEQFADLNEMKDITRRLVEIARAEFFQWSRSYKEAHVSAKLRFFIGDAIAFAHTLQHKHDTKRSTAHWYRHQYSFQPLELNGPEYTSNTAPLQFDVIDTSNLSDHLSSLVLLTATAPLLQCQSSSVLFTEFLVKSHKTYRGGLDSMLGGHVPTLSTILGLFPVEYWANTSGSPISKNSKDKLSSSREGQLFLRTTWKSLPWMSPSRVGFNTEDLTNLLYKVYANLFLGEDKKGRANASGDGCWHSSQLTCHHAGFASFLRLVQTRVISDWNRVLYGLVQRIKREYDKPGTREHVEEFYTFLHMMGLFSCDTTIRKWWNSNRYAALSNDSWRTVCEIFGDLRNIRDMPPIICITVKVPREKLHVPTKMDSIAPVKSVVYCIIQGTEKNPQKNIFGACQLCFGEISAAGKGYDPSFTVSVTEDPSGLNGTSPLIAAFYIPSYLLARPAVEVSLRLRTGRKNEDTLISRLSPRSATSETANSDMVATYITQYAPNQTGFPVATGFTPLRGADTRVDSSLIPRVNLSTGHIVAFTGVLEIKSEISGEAAEKDYYVALRTSSPCELEIRVGNTSPMMLTLPVIFSGFPKLVVDRVCSQIKATVEVADILQQKKRHRRMYPLYLRTGQHMAWNVPYVNLAKCLTIHLDQPDKMDWLRTHLSTAISTRERVGLLIPGLPLTPSDGERCRAFFKETLCFLYALRSAPRNERHFVFGLHIKNKKSGIIILAKDLLLDLSTRSAVLDCAISISTDVEDPGFKGISERGFCTKLVANRGELRHWQQNLPVYVERCRTWAHRDDCEYVRAGKIPLVGESGRPILCACGNGKFDADFHIDSPHWKDLSSRFVRAAITPTFLNPFVDDIFRPGTASGPFLDLEFEDNLL
ncbi:hypothetical protein F4678DRAFT_471001 [Xylaria arbuscula]|nr:hypothetical protein F4678DRAFT_471001 [Xylaria arbuscula]